MSTNSTAVVRTQAELDKALAANTGLIRNPLSGGCLVDRNGHRLLDRNGSLDRPRPSRPPTFGSTVMA